MTVRSDSSADSSVAASRPVRRRRLPTVLAGRPVRLRASVAAAVLLVVVSALPIPVGVSTPIAAPRPAPVDAATAPGDVGTEDMTYGSSVSGPTAEKPQSKLWWNDGVWWGILWSRQGSTYDIWKFNWNADSWSDTGTAVETRNRTRADALWDGTKLYVLSHPKEGTTQGDLGIKVLRFSYSTSTKKYTLDGGFPVTVATAAVEAGVIDKDTTGKLWITYTLANSSTTRAVYVSHTTTNDLTWTTPFVIPATGATNLTSDDISALVSYNGKIGVMWSNQNAGTMYFASHTDGAADSAWVQNPALQGPSYADDHINLKSLQADASGQVFAAVKTSLNDVNPPTSQQPLILLLILDGNGSWQRRTFGVVADNHTRPMVLIDNQNRQLYMFAVAPCCSGGVIYMKQTSLDNPNFAPGIGTPFISIAADPIMTNPTSTKQSVNSTTGILVEAADDHSQKYAHNKIDLSPADTTPPDTSISAGPSGTVGSTSASFSFSSTETGSTFACSLDGATPSACTSPKAYSGLADGSHTFTVAATDTAGNTDPTPASRTWTVDTSAPDTTITSGPSGQVNTTSASFAFSATKTGSTFACSLDGATPSACTSPQAYSALADGSHTFTVAATDTAGNTDPTPASRTWTIDTTAPSTPVISSPADGSYVASHTVTLAGTADSGVTVTVREGTSIVATTTASSDGSWTATVPSVDDGSHAYAATATDAAGNSSAASAGTTVVVDTTPPDTSIDAGPTGTVGSASATFSFSATEPGATFACSLDGAGPTACSSPATYDNLANGDHTFSVVATDRAGNADPTPATGTWTVDLAVPDTTPPTVAVSAPADGSSVRGSVTLTATATDDVAVDHVDLLVDGTVVGTITGAGPYTVSWDSGTHADGNATVTARAVDTSNNSATSAERTIVVDNAPPDTSISAGPSGTVGSTSASFSFSSTETGSTFACSLDGATPSACTSPKAYSGLADGSHTFTVAATDTAGNTDPTPASRTWTVDTSAPDTTITSGPSGQVNTTSASFAFSATKTGSTFACSLDGATPSACTSPQAYSALADGSHTFTVAATDTAGNTDPSPASRTWTIDTTAPDTSLSGGPTGTATSDSATFTLGSTEAGSTFLCTLDAGIATPCTSPRTYVSLPEGTHTLTVAAVDAAGNVDATPTSRTWTVDLRGGTSLFSDGFESGNYSAWTTVSTGGDGTATVQGTTVKTGSWAAALAETGTSGSLAFARARFGIPRTDVTATADVQVTAEGTSGNNVPLLRLYDSAASRLVSVYRLNLSKNQLGVSYGGAFFTTTGTLPLNTWGQVSLHVVSAAAGASTVEVRLNGTLIHRTTTATIPPASQVQIGNETARQAGAVIVDNVSVADTAGAPQTTASTVPNFDHIFVVVEENKATSQVIGQGLAPYLNGLAAANGFAANYRPITHPSLPNYLAMTGASTFGITTDCNPIGTGACPVGQQNLADSIEASGRTWRGYMDSMPLPCTTTSVNNYVVRHNPFIYYDDIRNDNARCVNSDVPIDRLATDLQSTSTTPSFAFIVPDKCNDMHDCPVATGDAWLQANLPTIFNSPAWTTQNSLLVITWDEDDEGASSIGTVATVLVGPAVRHGAASYAPRDHYSLLRTIEDAWGLPRLTANDAGAQSLGDLLTTP